MIKKSVLEDTGYFDENIRAGVDVELAIRVSKKYRFGFVNRVLVKVTRNHEQIMADAKNQILGKEIIYNKHNDYLSDKILYSNCKMIANYYILTNNYEKAIEYLKKSFKHKFELKTLIQYITIILTPRIISYFYYKKYKGNIPLTSGLKR